MSRRKRSQNRKQKTEEVIREDLDRFAGSSEEEEEEEDALVEEENDKSETPKVKQSKRQNESDSSGNESDHDDEKNEENGHPIVGKDLKKVDNDEDDDDEEEDDDSSDSNDNANESRNDEREEVEGSGDDAETMDASAKMANAMARILGTSAGKKTGANVLSKTTTPLQRMAQKEKEARIELKVRRNANRERNLTAMHIPLSVATTSLLVDSGGGNGGASSSISKELEQERIHRRVATRGAVALFNAITQHQKGDETNDMVESAGKKETVKKLTKHGFLDKIKSTAAAAVANNKSLKKSLQGESDQPVRNKRKESSPADSSKWNALKDDYMLDSKKNWDLESSDDEGSTFADEASVGGDDEEEEHEEAKEVKLNRSKTKRRRVKGAQVAVHYL